MSRRGGHGWSPHSRRGIAAIALVVVLAMISMAIIGMVLEGARDQDLSETRMSTVRAFYAAESGVSMGLREVFVGNDLDGDGGIGSISDDGNSGNDPQIGVARVNVSREASAGSTLVISNASSGSSTHRIESSAGADTDGTAPGLWVEQFQSATALNTLTDVDWTATPDSIGVVSQVNFASASGQAWPGGPTDNWARHYSGKITVAQSGTWTFYTNSDDGSDLWIDGSRVVSNDGTHAMQLRSGSVALSAGQHDIEIHWFERTGVFGLVLSWSGPGVASQTVVPASALSH